MRVVVRGKDINELDRRVAQKERSGWVRITENKIDDSLSNYGKVEWVCVMELKNGLPDKVKRRRFIDPY